MSVPEFPADHPLAGHEEALDGHDDHLETYGDVLQKIDPERVDAAMVVLILEDGTETLPTVHDDVDAFAASHWMLGAHISHVTNAMNEFFDEDVSAEQVAEVAIRYISQLTGETAVYGGEDA